MNRAAFFDVDGTLIAKPSLERRFVRALLYERKISPRNGFAWLREALRLAPSGLTYMLQGNKAYLRGIRSTGARADRVARSAPFFPEAAECVAQHAANDERIVLVSGTLEILAEEIAQRLRAELAKRNLFPEIHVCATRLEEKGGQWTGQILGKPMFGEAKAVAVWWLAEKWKLNLTECSAYGDSVHDQWMLASVGKPVAVNPDERLRDIAQNLGWKIVTWRRQARESTRPSEMVPERAR